jgi:hypothetical protein
LAFEISWFARMFWILVPFRKKMEDIKILDSVCFENVSLKNEYSKIVSLKLLVIRFQRNAI